MVGLWVVDQGGRRAEEVGCGLSWVGWCVGGWAPLTLGGSWVGDLETGIRGRTARKGGATKEEELV